MAITNRLFENSGGEVKNKVPTNSERSDLCLRQSHPILFEMKYTIISFLLFITVSCLGQTFVSNQEHIYYTNILYNVNKGYVLPGHSDMWSDAIFTAQSNKIFKGFSTSTFDILYQVEDGKLYIGESTFSTDILFTIVNGKIYRGDSTMMMDCIYTYDPVKGMMYKGDSHFKLDAVLFFQGEPLKNAELFALLFAMNML